MSWGALVELGVTLRPYESPPPSGETPSPFEAPFRSTLDALHRELDFLSAKRIVLQVGYREQDLRLDGMPRANVRMLHDAVALSFESKWGALRYETNEFVPRSYRGGEGWQHNLRAIALAMEALRRVDRYGVSKRGEQYTGYRALPQRAGSLTVEQARDLLARYGGETEALKATHPDRGGDADEFAKVQEARHVLGTV